MNLGLDINSRSLWVQKNCNTDFRTKTEVLISFSLPIDKEGLSPTGLDANLPLVMSS